VGWTTPLDPPTIGKAVEIRHNGRTYSVELTDGKIVSCRTKDLKPAQRQHGGFVNRRVRYHPPLLSKRLSWVEDHFLPPRNKFASVHEGDSVAVIGQDQTTVKGFVKKRGWKTCTVMDEQGRDFETRLSSIVYTGSLLGTAREFHDGLYTVELDGMTVTAQPSNVSEVDEPCAGGLLGKRVQVHDPEGRIGGMMHQKRGLAKQWDPDSMSAVVSFDGEEQDVTVHFSNLTVTSDADEGQFLQQTVEVNGHETKSKDVPYWEKKLYYGSVGLCRMILLPLVGPPGVLIFGLDWIRAWCTLPPPTRRFNWKQTKDLVELRTSS